MIRPATAADLSALVDLGAAAHAESPHHRSIPFSSDRLAESLAEAIEGGGVLTAENEGRLVGALMGFLHQPFFSKATVASECGFYVAPEARGGMVAARLLSGLEAWAAEQGAAEVCSGTSSGVGTDRTAALLRRLGWIQYAMSFKKRVP